MVSRILEIHPAATEEADAATDWYARRSLFAARAFVSELIHAVDQVAEEPERWPFFEDDTRAVRLSKISFQPDISNQARKNPNHCCYALQEKTRILEKAIIVSESNYMHLLSRGSLMLLISKDSKISAYEAYGLKVLSYP